MTTEARIKGLAFSSSIGALEAIRGPEAVARVMERMPEELASAIRRGEVMPNGWYPIDWYAAFLEGVSGEPEGDELLLEVGRVSTDHDFNRIHRILLRRLTPSTIMKVVGRVYGRYFTRGSIEVVESGRGYLRVRWVDCQGFNRPMWLDAFGAAQKILELSGARDLDVRLIAGGREGDTTMDVEARYT